eukprot:scaffold5352_cov94-Cylindrotheca_fusiformis.AAC.1
MGGPGLQATRLSRTSALCAPQSEIRGTNITFNLKGKLNKYKQQQSAKSANDVDPPMQLSVHRVTGGG